jgi:hypothetical protein
LVRSSEDRRHREVGALGELRRAGDLDVLGDHTRPGLPGGVGEVARQDLGVAVVDHHVVDQVQQGVLHGAALVLEQGRPDALGAQGH